MIIYDKEYGKFEVCLVDDGTLDTVLDVYHYAPNGFHLRHKGTTQIRFSQEYAASFRNDTGTMTDKGFAELAIEAVEAYYIEQHYQYLI